MQKLQRYQTDEPYYKAMGMNDISQTERDNQYCKKTNCIQTTQINYISYICIENATGEIQREK